MGYDETITYWLTCLRRAYRELNRLERVEHNNMQVKHHRGAVQKEMESVGSVEEDIDGVNLKIINGELYLKE